MAEKKIAIIGLGLIGGSLGLALKQARGSKIEIIGFARRPEVAAEAIRLGAVDRTQPNLAAAVSDADTVIIATPVLAIETVLQELSDSLLPNAIVSDVGSTKTRILTWAKQYLPSTIDFIGGHPMAGKEATGIDEARADLFADCIYCLTPGEDARVEAVEAMQTMVEWTGAKPLVIDSKRHDELVAGISHLPLVLSATLVSSLAQSPLWPEMSKLAASGYRDMTRLAMGSPVVHQGICKTNREAIVDWIDRYIEMLKKYRRIVADDDQALQQSLHNARETRRIWLESDGQRFVE
ncbi:MAG: prephenate dehydrogenase/arogenate dehydrogenase family protein [Chloroflexota bacterium]|nr:prephenate dehydrogenase/arogenate dehydrogenase family protein [Chloroflexota bacterium]